jgi:hypothetical protein
MSNYVYVYSIEGAPIYVGIGCDTDGSFVRARNIAGHPEVAKRNVDQIIVEIVVRNISRKSALLLEALLIDRYAAHHVLDNKVRPKLRGKLEPITFVRGAVRKRGTKRIAEAEDFEADAYDEYMLRHNFDTDAPVPFDNPEAPPAQRVREFLDHFSYGSWRFCSVDQVRKLALAKSRKEFCQTLAAQVDCDAEGYDKTFRKQLHAWFNSDQPIDELPVSAKKFNSEIAWWFTNLYRFIRAFYNGVSPQKGYDQGSLESLWSQLEPEEGLSK